MRLPFKLFRLLLLEKEIEGLLVLTGSVFETDLRHLDEAVQQFLPDGFAL